MNTNAPRAKETIGFSRMESPFQPNRNRYPDRKRPSASAAWSLHFNLTAIAIQTAKRPSASAAWSLHFNLTTIAIQTARDHRLQPHGVSISTCNRKNHYPQLISFTDINLGPKPPLLATIITESLLPQRVWTALTCSPMNPFFTVLESAYQLHYYLGFRTYFRKPLIATSKEHELVKSVLDDVSLRENYHLLETTIEQNHLRLLLSLKPNQRVSRVIQMLKGNIAREFGLTCKEQLALHRVSRLWAKGYFLESSGKVNLEAARRYVESQASHHGYQGNWSKELKFRNESFVSPAFDISHSLAILNYHIVLVTHRRIPIFDEIIAPHFFEYVMKVGAKHKFVVDRMSLLPDHLHLLIEAIPNVSVEECVLAIMNNTHQWMMKRYFGVLKGTRGWNVWQPSFYAGTVGEYTTAQVKRFLG